MTEQDRPLDKRKEDILREIIEGYVEGGEPVGSKTVARGSDLGVSAATVRNEMGILEREGYISHPHTSAGRVPTDKGYRYYVDQLAPRHIADPERRREIEDFLVGAFSALDDILERTSQLLVELTDYTSLASPPSLEAAAVSRVELVKLSGPRVLAVVVGEGGWHIERIVDLDAEPTTEVITRSVEACAAAVGGRTLIEAGRRVGQLELGGDATQLVERLSASLIELAGEERRIVTGGTSRIVVWEPIETAQRVLERLETGTPLLPKAAPDDITVRIGHELAAEDLRDLSLIATGYRFGKQSGALGVLGPTRMDYPAVIATVADVASTLSRVLRGVEEHQ